MAPTFRLLSGERLEVKGKSLQEVREAIASQLAVAPRQLHFLPAKTHLEDLGDEEVQVCVQTDPLEDALAEHLNLSDFQELLSLKSLEVEGWPHHRLPEQIEEMAHLKSLIIKTSSLELLSLPPCLRVLFLEKLPRIRQLPPLDGQEGLQVLQVRSTRLEELPSLPQSLDFLQLDKCSLKRLPEGLRGLKHLKRLSLDGNELTELPDLPVSLEKLSVQKNALQRLPGSFPELAALQSLFLSGNSLMELPADFGELKNLKELHLGGNQLRTLPESFGDLRELRKLDLERNPIRKVPATCGNIQKLEELFIDGEKLEEWPCEHWRNLYYDIQFMAGT